MQGESCNRARMADDLGPGGRGHLLDRRRDLTLQARLQPLLGVKEAEVAVEVAAAFRCTTCEVIGVALPAVATLDRSAGSNQEGGERVARTHRERG